MGLGISTENFAIVNPKLEQYKKLMKRKLDIYNDAKKYIDTYGASSQDRKTVKYKQLNKNMETAENEYHKVEKLYCNEPGLVDYLA